MLIPRRDLDFQLSTSWTSKALRHERFGNTTARSSMACSIRHTGSPRNVCAVRRRQRRDEPRIVDGRAWTIPETRAALAAYNEASFTAATFDADDGGLQLPLSVAKACTAVFSSANVAFHSYAALTAGAADLLATSAMQASADATCGRCSAGGSPGRCAFRTACRLLAYRHPLPGPAAHGRQLPPDGHQDVDLRWDHDLAETIVHLVLAKLPDAPAGVRGISLSPCRETASAMTRLSGSPTTCGSPG